MKDDLIGKQFTTNKSGVCVITKYVGYNEVHIKFLDTNFECVTDMNSLRKGQVKDASLSKTIKKYAVGKEDIVGKTFANNKGQKYVVLEKISTTKFNVKFVDSGYETQVDKISIEIGNIKDRTILNTFKTESGFDHSQNKYLTDKSKTTKSFATEQGLLKEYQIWSNIVVRCNRGYAKLHEEFYKFESWLKWASNQKGFMKLDSNGNIFQLDSDLFSKAEKIYSPTSCVFVPREINSLCKPNVNRTGLPRGVSISFDGVSKNLGCYTTLEEASLVSKEARLNRVKFLEDKYKHTVESKVFDELRKDKWIL